MFSFLDKIMLESISLAATYKCLLAALLLSVDSFGLAVSSQLQALSDCLRLSGNLERSVVTETRWNVFKFVS